jgi:hypothetical protein
MTIYRVRKYEGKILGLRLTGTRLVKMKGSASSSVKEVRFANTQPTSFFSRKSLVLPRIALGSPPSSWFLNVCFITNTVVTPSDSRTPID